ncbi:oligosaccharide flippase family protein [Methylophilales bacterium]|nr:oligosaccharide flippase family protein [Methylophilales bacterium]
MKQKVRGIFLSKLIRGSSWLFMGGVSAGVLGYLFQIIMGRMLSVSEYGIFSALMAMIIVIGAPMSALTMIIARRVSAFRSDKDISNLSHLFFWINRRLILISIVLIVIIIFNAKSLQNFLLIEKSVYLFSLVAIILIAFPQAIINGFLQGLQYFKWLALSSVFVTFLKIIFAITLIYVGLGVTGALGGVIFSSLALLIITYIILYPSIKKTNVSGSSSTQLLFKSSFPVLLANFAFAIMTQIDIVLVKHYFSSQEAGIYAAASILGKAVMYLPSGISSALFPMVAENHASGESSQNLFLQAVSLTFLLSLIGALFYYFFADNIILLFYGDDYKEASNILKYFGFAILPMSLIMIAEQFLIAIGRVLFAYLFVIVAPLQIIVIYFYHDSVLNILLALFISGSILVISGYGFLWREFKK